MALRKLRVLRRLRAGYGLPSRLREEVARAAAPTSRLRAAGAPSPARGGLLRPARVAAARALLRRGELENEAALTRAAAALLGLRPEGPPPDVP